MGYNSAVQEMEVAKLQSELEELEGILVDI